MSETLLAVIIGGAFGFLGALIGILTNVWLENQRTHNANITEIRRRLVGDHPQLSETMRFIRLQRKRKWPMFWKREQPDLSLADLKGISLSKQDLRNVIFYRADLSHADLDYSDLRGADLSKATLRKADLHGANLSNARLDGIDLSEANLYDAIITEEQLLQARSIKGAILPTSLQTILSSLTNNEQ